MLVKDESTIQQYFVAKETWLRALACRMLGDQEEARDALQDLAVCALEAVRDGREWYSCYMDWRFHNVVRSRQRARRRLPLIKGSEPIEYDDPDYGLPMDEKLEIVQFFECICVAFPEECEFLLAVDEFGVAAMAEMLDVSRNALHQRVHRYRNRLLEAA